jgi:hypothetical protein
LKSLKTIQFFWNFKINNNDVTNFFCDKFPPLCKT